MVLENGEIIERGTHTQLLAKNNVYANLYNGQNLFQNHTKEKEEYKTMWVDNIDSIQKRLFSFDKKNSICSYL